MGSALVGTAGTQYMLCADKRAADGSAAHLDCLLLDHYYRMALDKLPPDVLTVEYMPRLPPHLRSSDYPHHLKPKYDDRRKRDLARGVASSVKLVASNPHSLMGKFYSQILESPTAEQARIRLDKDLRRERWPRPTSSESSEYRVADYQEQHLKRWRTLRAQYVKEQAALSRELLGDHAPGEASLSYDDDAEHPFWARHRELVDKYRKLLFDKYTAEEIVFGSHELYAEVSAIYELCYGIAKGKQEAREQAREQGQQHKQMDSGSSDDDNGRTDWDALIKWPWRLAADQLKEMKSKAKKLESLTNSRALVLR